MIKRRNNRGSILIWTVMLGLLMTTVFFYAAIRFGNLESKQQETIEYQTQKAFFDSYMNYLKAHPDDMSGDYEGIEEGVNNINITLTQVTDEITGVVESYGEATEITFADISGDATGDTEVKIEYNYCGESANIETDPTYTVGPASQPCASFDFDNYVMVPIAVNEDLTLTSLDAPFHYRITGTDLKDTKWHLDADMKFGFGKRLRESSEF